MGNISALGGSPDASPATETYSYDPLYRLTAVNGAVSEAYTYSKTGDRLSKVGGILADGAYGYQSGSHWLTSTGTSARVYNAIGDTTGSAIAGQNLGFGYDNRNQMIIVQRGGQTVGTYTYNALGQRIGKIATFPQSISERYGYDQASHLIGEYGSNSRDYVWVADLPVAVVDTTGATSTVSYVHFDGLGTPRAVTSATGVTIWQWGTAGNPFGEQLPTATAGYAFNLRYPGQYFDAESAAIYNVNRYYDPASGRYIQSDPVGLVGGISTYAYVGSNPLDFADPLGLCPDDSGESGRYTLCNASQDPNSSWVTNKMKMWGCKKTVDATCNSAEGSSTCCEADYNGCTGGKVLGEPPADPKEAMKMGKCMVKFTQCMGSGGKGG